MWIRRVGRSRATPGPRRPRIQILSVGSGGRTFPPRHRTLVEVTAPRTDISAPPGQWLRITRDDGTTQLAAVYRPEDDTAYPIVVVLHGTGACCVAAAGAATLADTEWSSSAAISPGGCRRPGRPGLPEAVAEHRGRRSDARRRTTRFRCSGWARERAAGHDRRRRPSVGGGVALASMTQPGRSSPTRTSGRPQAQSRAPVLLLGFTEDPIAPHDNVVRSSRRRSKRSPVEPVYYPVDFITSLSTERTQDDASRPCAWLPRPSLDRTDAQATPTAPTASRSPGRGDEVGQD